MHPWRGWFVHLCVYGQGNVAWWTIYELEWNWPVAFQYVHSLLLLFTIIRDRIDRICDPLKNRYLLQREILGKLFWYILSEDFRHLSIILIYKLLEDIALHLQRVLEDGREHWKLVSVIKCLTLSFPLGLTESKRVVVIFNNREEWCRWKDSVRLISIISLRVSRKLTVHVEREPAPSLGG